MNDSGLREKAIWIYRKASFVTVLRDDANPIGLDSCADEGVDVVVTDLSHPPNLPHRFPTDLLSLGENELFDTNVCASIGRHFGENLVHGHARQAQLQLQ